MSRPNNDNVPVEGDVSYSRVAVRGMSLAGAAVVSGKAASLASQLVLGWILSKSDFTIYALAISVSTVVAVFLHGGLHRVLIQSGPGFERVASGAFQIALIFNGFAGLLLILIGSAAVKIYSQPALMPVIWVLALWMLLATPGMVYSARLITTLRFKELTVVGVKSVLLKHVLMIAFAFAGAGPLSFVLPQVITALYEWISYRSVAGPLGPRQQSLAHTFKALFPSARWVMASSPAISLTQFGDYLIIGRMQQALLAPYFFGYQLINSVVHLFAGALLNVVVPTLAKIGDDAARQAQAYLKALRLLVYVAAPIGFVCALIAGPLIHFMWSGKWDEAIPVVEIMALSLAFSVLNPLAVAALQAIGNWGLVAILLAVHAASTLAMTALGCISDDLTLITSLVAIQHAANAIAQAYVAGRCYAVHAGKLLMGIFAPYVLCGLIAGALRFFFVARWDLHPLAFAIVTTSLFAILYYAASLLLVKDTAREALSLLVVRR
jgi:PST family polysaccharide transporter